MKRKALAILTVIFGAPLAAQWLDYPTPGIPRTRDGKPNLSAPAPRTADGKPDLSGVWNRVSPKYGRNIAADLKPGEIQPWAAKLVQERRENLAKDYMNVLCVPLGPSYATVGDTTGAEMMKIIQTPSLIVILNPDLTYRQIFMDGRPLEKSPNPNWMGYSVGRWEGDTLVVESSGFNDRTWLDHDGHPHTEALRTTERYRRRNFGNIDLEVTLSDPGAYTRPWTVVVTAQLAPDTELLEWACNEKGSGTEHWVGKASDERKNEVKVAAAVLAKYVGTYDEQPRVWSQTNVPRIVVITVLGETIFGEMDGRGKVALVGRSETEFAGLYGLGVEFTRDTAGVASQLFVKHVSGNYRFQRRK